VEWTGLTGLGFPCSPFFDQQSGTESEITRFWRENFGVTFPIFSRLKVNGKSKPLMPAPEVKSENIPHW